MTGLGAFDVDDVELDPSPAGLPPDSWMRGVLACTVGPAQLVPDVHGYLVFGDVSEQGAVKAALFGREVSHCLLPEIAVNHA